MRKFSGKTAALAGMLGLCLALSGCYIAPDDINDNTSWQTSSGNLPFQTLAPKPTAEVTPDTVVVETQSLFPGQNQQGGQNGGTIAVTDSGQPAPTPTPTPAQGSAGWSDWGTVSGVTNPPESGVTVSVIPPSTPDNGTIILETRSPTPEQ